MSDLISFKTSWKHGLVPYKALDQIWKQFPVYQRAALLLLLEKFEVVYKIRSSVLEDDENAGNYFVIPSMLKLKPSEPQLNEPVPFKDLLENTHINKKIYFRTFWFPTLLTFSFLFPLIHQIVFLSFLLDSLGGSLQRLFTLPTSPSQTCGEQARRF